MHHISYIKKKDFIIGNFLFSIHHKISQLMYFIFALTGTYFQIIDSQGEYSILGILIFFIIQYFIILGMLFIVYIVYGILAPYLTKGVFGEHNFEFTEDSIIESTIVNKSEFKYSGIDKIYTQFGYIVIHVSGMQGYVLPSRDFKNKEERLILLDFLRDKGDEYNFSFQDERIVIKK